MLQVKILYLHISNDTTNSDVWISKYLPKDKYDFEAISIPPSSLLKRLVFVFFIKKRLSKYDVLVTSEYYLSFFLNLRLLLSKCKTRHIVWGINQSRRLLLFRTGFLNKIVNSIFDRSNKIVVHSNHEAKLFFSAHNFSPRKTKFVHWGFDLPALKEARFVDFDDDYICMIGRNNRDWATFATAVKLSKVNAVAVCSNLAESDRSMLLASGIHIYEDIDMIDCFNIIKHSRANVVLVKDDDRGAGHITVVAAMFMSKSQVISKVEVLSDYFIDGSHGYMVPINSPEATSNVILKIWNNKTLREMHGRRAKEYAEKWFTNKHIAYEFDLLVKDVCSI